MAIRPRRIPNLPPISDPALRNWLEGVASAINGLPISVFSTSDGPNSSAVTAPVGFIGIETGSSSTPLWVKTGSGGTYWSALSHRAY